MKTLQEVGWRFDHTIAGAATVKIEKPPQSIDGGGF
jgi:hypothetical protein